MSDALSDRERWLAAEFALGVLPTDRQRLAEQKFESELAFREAVEAWQEQLSVMLEEVEPVTPSPQVWAAIEKRVFGKQSQSTGGTWSSLRFWRGLSLITSALATASIVALLVLVSERGPTTDGAGKPLVATLTASGESVAFLARFDPGQGRMIVRFAADPGDAVRVPELWLIPDDGVPRSLGVLSGTGSGELTIQQPVQQLIQDGATLAVSLEPAGGSPAGAPTGPVIASGKLQSF